MYVLHIRSQALSFAHKKCKLLHKKVKVKLALEQYTKVSIETRHRLGGPGSDPGGGEIFRTRKDLSWGPPNFLYNGYRVFTGG